MAPEPYPIRLPEFDKGFPEAELVRWLVEPGCEVHDGDPIAEVETYKSLVETDSPVCGVVLELVSEEGRLVAVNEMMLTVRRRDRCPACARR